MSRFEIDGHVIDFEVRGEGQPAFMLHGLAADRAVMIEACEPVLARAPIQRVYLDLPGHGRSTGNAERASADLLVAALGALVRALSGDEAPLLVGYSYGSYLAQGLVRDLPRVAGLFLVCPTVEADFGKRTVPPRRVAVRDAVLAFGDDPREQIAFEEVAVVQTAAMLETFRRVVHPANVAADQGLMAATRGRYAMSRPYLQALQAFAGPVSIVCGRDDHWVGWEDAARLARAFCAGQLTVLPHCGHLLPLEEPVRFQALLADWLGRARAT